MMSASSLTIYLSGSYMLSCGLISSESPREILQAIPFPEALIKFFCTKLWILVISSAPQITLMCSQGRSVVPCQVIW